MESEITGCEFLGYSQYNKLPLVRLNTDDIDADEPPDEIMVCIEGKDEFYEFKKIPNCRMFTSILPIFSCDTPLIIE